MASYFDHFISVKILNLYINDLLFILLLVIIITFIFSYNSSLVPSNFQFIMEKIYTHWGGVIKENLGEGYEYFKLPLFSLFIFLLGINFLSFFLFTFPPTTHLSITFGLSFSL